MTTAAFFVALFSIQVPSLPPPEPLQTSSLSNSQDRSPVLRFAAASGARSIESFFGAAVYTPNYAFSQTQLICIGGAIGAGVGAWAGHAVCGG